MAGNNHQEGETLNFQQASSECSSINVELTQHSRTYSDAFQLYKFYYRLRMHFQDGDSSLYVSDLLNLHADALGEIFNDIFRVIIAGVLLQQFQQKSDNRQ